MKNQKNIEEEVACTMHSLDGLERAETNSYFYSRLEARLASRERETLLSSLQAKPRYMAAAAAMALVIVFNVFSMAEYEHYFKEQKNIQQTEEVGAFVAEYGLTMPVLYDAMEGNDGY